MIPHPPTLLVLKFTSIQNCATGNQTLVQKLRQSARPEKNTTKLSLLTPAYADLHPLALKKKLITEMSTF